jgi:hypothetical protein
MLDSKKETGTASAKPLDEPKGTEEISTASNPITTKVPKKAHPTTKHSTRDLIIKLIFVVVVLLASGIVVYLNYLLRQPDHIGDVAQQTALDPVLDKFVHPTTGEHWLSKMVQLPDQGFYTRVPGDDLEITYYKVGTHGANDIVLSRQAPAEDELTLFEKTPQGVVSAVQFPNANEPHNIAQYTDMFNQGFIPSIKVDTTTHYDSLSVPSQISIGYNQTVHWPIHQYESGSYIGSISYLVYPQEGNGIATCRIYIL